MAQLGQKVLWLQQNLATAAKTSINESVPTPMRPFLRMSNTALSGDKNMSVPITTPMLGTIRVMISSSVGMLSDILINSAMSRVDDDCPSDASFNVAELG